MRRLSRLRDAVTIWQGTDQRIRDAIELAEMGDEEMLPSWPRKPTQLEQLVGRLAFRAKLSGEYDAEDALLAIHAGAGAPTRRTGRRCCCACMCAGQSGAAFKVEIVDEMPGDEAGIKSATLCDPGRLRVRVSEV